MTPTIEDVLRKYMLNDGRADIIYFEDAVKAMTEYASLNRQGWTRVEDGLPEVSDEPIYLAYHSPMWQGHFHITQCGFKSIGAGIWPHVTHWMPLPNKPSI